MQWQELLKELESTKTALKKTRLDLDSECEARRRLQEEVQGRREWEERHGRRPFVVALIDADADGYVVSGPCAGSGSLSMPASADLVTIVSRQLHHKRGEGWRRRG
jgi:hypothetical protein